MVTKAELDACDGLDGAKDGIVSNVVACRVVFHIDALRCGDGNDIGAACPSDAQIATYKTFAAAMPFAVTLSGIDHFAGWPVLDGAHPGGKINTFGADSKPAIPATPQKLLPLHDGRYDGVRHVVKDPMSNSLTFDQVRNGPALEDVSRIIDGSSGDITAFQKRGGKLLIMHGMIDMAVSPYNTVEYYERLRKRYGDVELRKFVRFYMAPVLAMDMALSLWAGIRSARWMPGLNMASSRGFKLPLIRAPQAKAASVRFANIPLVRSTAVLAMSMQLPVLPALPVEVSFPLPDSVDFPAGPSRQSHWWRRITKGPATKCWTPFFA